MVGKVIIFSAPSGAGKTTVVKHLLNIFPQLEFSISATSRKIRGNEIHGKDYFYISADEFRDKINNQDFIEWEEVYENCYYGTLRSEIHRIWTKGNVVVFDVDVKGGMNLKRVFGDNALSIFISPPSLQILEERLRARSTDDEESIIKRINKAGLEMNFSGHFDKTLLNNDLQNTLKIAENWIKEWI
ncbi:MAG: guanylate kinase [Bacteroidia bacterium]|nr:guanylate kinase [Bacteroidia bacterium]